MRWEIRNILENILNAVLLVISLFLIGRIVFRLFAANPSTPFVSWVYDISAYLMTPFRGMFDTVSVARGSVLDVPALVAVVAYALIGLLIMYLIRMLTGGSTTHEELDEQSHAHPRQERTRPHYH